jgi:hydrogenase maturation protease
VRPHRIVVVAVGNPFASDDGVAHRVVAAAAPRLPDDVVRVAAHGEPARLVEAWSGADTAVVVDAVDGPGPAGDVTVLDGRALPAAGPVRRAHGSHALGVVEAVRLAEALGRLPRRVVCVGVTGRRWDPGDELSPEVAAAVDAAADAVVRAVADAAAEVR